MSSFSDFNSIGPDQSIGIEQLLEYERKEQELYGQISKWSDLYYQTQNKLYENEKFCSSSIIDLAPVGGGIRDNNGLLNDLGHKVTLLGIKGLIPAINNFIKLMRIDLPQIEIYDAKKETELSNCIKNLFNKYGSDKSYSHDYHLFYAEVFEKLPQTTPLNILEIGLGSQNPAIPSRMSGQFSIGSSLRAYREFFPNANIFGGDIDKDILFTEDRINTSYVNQLDIDSFEEMQKQFNYPIFDLIIEDGLHSFVASLNTLNFALQYTKNNSIIVLEDLSNIDLWQIICQILKNNQYKTQLINSKGYALIIYL